LFQNKHNANHFAQQEEVETGPSLYGRGFASAALSFEYRRPGSKQKAARKNPCAESWSEDQDTCVIIMWRFMNDRLACLLVLLADRVEEQVKIIICLDDP